MKVGIMSMQRVINNGSLLQAYGLKKVLEGLGNQVEFVDFKIGDLDLVNDWRSKLNKRSLYLYIIMMFLKKFLKLDFKDWKLSVSNAKFAHNFSSCYLKSLELTENPNYSPQVDILIFGSDEVFNTVQYVDLYNQYVWELYGSNNNAKKLISYAASFGHTTLEGLKKHNMVGWAAFYLNCFENISVRDKNSYEIIKELTGKDAIINIDPVLLYDFHDIEINKPELENYILVYAYPGRINRYEEIKTIKSFAKKYNKKLVCVNMMQTWCDETIYVHPFELLSYFKYADYVVTDTFHGAVISVKYNRPFMQFIRNSNLYSNNQKVGYFLHCFGLEKRIIRDLSEFQNIMTEPIDYENVNKILEREREISMEYLQQALVIN